MMSSMKEILENSFRELELLVNKEYLDQLKTAPEDSLDKYQHPLGTIIRLRLLKNKCPLYRLFLEHGYESRDEMSMVIIRAYHAWLREKADLFALS